MVRTKLLPSPITHDVRSKVVPRGGGHGEVAGGLGLAVDAER